MDSHKIYGKIKLAFDLLLVGHWTQQSSRRAVIGFGPLGFAPALRLRNMLIEWSLTSYKLMYQTWKEADAGQFMQQSESMTILNHNEMNKSFR